MHEATQRTEIVEAFQILCHIHDIDERLNVSLNCRFSDSSGGWVWIAAHLVLNALADLLSYGLCSRKGFDRPINVLNITQLGGREMTSAEDGCGSRGMIAAGRRRTETMIFRQRR